MQGVSCIIEEKIRRPKWPWLLLVAVIIFFASVKRSSNNSESQSNISSEEPTATVSDTQKKYDQEISFEGFYWGESPVEAAQQLDTVYSESMTPSWSNAGKIMTTSDYQLGYQVYKYGNRSIAGYDVANFYMYFLYGHDNSGISISAEDAELYMVTMNLNVVDVQGAYDDLFNKLTSIYGHGNTTTSKDSAVSSKDGYYESTLTKTSWYGENNTGVILAVSIPDKELSESGDMWSKYVVLAYGKTDSDQTIDNLYQEYKSFVAESEEWTRDPSNTNGL